MTDDVDEKNRLSVIVGGPPISSWYFAAFNFDPSETDRQGRLKPLKNEAISWALGGGRDEPENESIFPLRFGRGSFEMISLRGIQDSSR